MRITLFKSLVIVNIIVAICSLFLNYVLHFPVLCFSVDPANGFSRIARNS